MQSTLTSVGDNVDELGKSTSMGRSPLPSIMAASVTALPAGRRTSSPAPRPTSPANSPFQPSSSQQSGLTTTSNNSKTAGRFSDAFSTIVGRNRTLSTDSNSRDLSRTRHLQTQAREEHAGESSFGIDADPFASHPGGSSNHLAGDPSTASINTTNNSLHRKQRGSLLFAASDALGFTRVGASITKRMTRRISMEQNANPSAAQTQINPQQRRGLPWKGKGKPKGHWALQPSSLHSMTDVIEISAAKSALTSVRDEEEENERRERDRLREAAAESIGISPLFREDASSRVTESDDMRYDNESIDERWSKGHPEASMDGNAVERLRALDRSRTNIAGTLEQHEKPVGLQLQQTRDNKHNRSSSLSGITTPTTPSATSQWPLPPLVPPVLSTNGRTPISSAINVTSRQQLPAFPCSFSALGPLSRKSSTILKFYASSPLLLSFSRQWRTRTIVLTGPPRPKSPSFRGFRPFTPPERLPSVYHLHLFKSLGPDERELQRLEVNEDSVVFVADEEIAGKRSVVKVGGIDVGSKKRELNVEENCQILWFLVIADPSEAQDWISTLKSAVLDQRAEKAGFAMPTDSLSSSGPKGDLDVMLTMRAHDVASTVRAHAHLPSRTSHEENRARNSDSPTPTTRSWSSERRRPISPSGRMVSLKGLFSVPGRTRSMLHGSTSRNEEESPTSPVDTPSFTLCGAEMLSMSRPTNVDATSSNPKSAPSSPVVAAQALPVPNPFPGPILSTTEMNFDKVSIKGRDKDLPEWYSIQSSQRNRGDSMSSVNAGPALLPPPRNRRPWTSAGLLNNSARQEQVRDNSPPSRRSFQSAISLHGARLSMDGRSRPSSPVESLGAATGALGAVDVGSKRASLSSSVSSFISTTPDRDQLAGRSPSGIQRRIRAGKLPKMLSPPAGPLPSAPQQPAQTFLLGESNVQVPVDGSPSRSSSLRSMSNSDSVQNGSLFTGRRLSESSVLSAGSTNQYAARGSYISLRTSKTLSPKRTSIPPPPRPAPTSALPPTPSDAIATTPSDSPKRTSFRQSLSHRSLRFSLSPPLSKSTSSRSDDPLRRRSVSSGASVVNGATSHVPIAPPAPPPTGPLPPTPRDPISNRYSIRERLRMKSAPSTPLGVRGSAGPPTTLPGSPPLVTVSSVASLKDNSSHSAPIGEPIAAIPKDLNFLNMSSPVDSSAPSTDDTDFLHVSTPISTTFSKQIPAKSTDYPPPEHSNGSPPTPEMTALPPPPRRGRNGTISEKDRDRSSQSLTSNITPATTDDNPSFHTQLEPAGAVAV
ncbi:hypothetical protein ACEPAG_1602 [Sanghuangporus baumii]